MKMLLPLPLFDNRAEKIAYLKAEVLKLERHVFLAERSGSWARADELDDLLFQHTHELEHTLGG